MLMALLATFMPLAHNLLLKYNVKLIKVQIASRLDLYQYPYI